MILKARTPPFTARPRSLFIFRSVYAGREDFIDVDQCIVSCEEGLQKSKERGPCLTWYSAKDAILCPRGRRTHGTQQVFTVGR